MISKNVFLGKIEDLQQLFNHELSAKQIDMYYEKLSKDMSDRQFLDRVQQVIENEYRFPPIASFYRDYKKDGSSVLLPETSNEYREAIRRALPVED